MKRSYRQPWATKGLYIVPDRRLTKQNGVITQRFEIYELKKDWSGGLIGDVRLPVFSKKTDREKINKMAQELATKTL